MIYLFLGVLSGLLLSGLHTSVTSSLLDPNIHINTLFSNCRTEEGN
jgi:hypothetical protein